MAWMFVYGACVVCGQMFTDADRVPSVRVKRGREPVCRACIERANAARATRHLPPIAVVPGAYEPEEVNG